MASSFKYLGNSDRVVSTTELQTQVINISGAVENAATNKINYLLAKSSSVEVFDVTLGKSSDVTVAIDTSSLQKEQIIYNQFAKVLLGTEIDGTIKKFKSLLPPDLTSSYDLSNAFFINFKRNQFKDKIKKGTFSLHMKIRKATGKTAYITDTSGSTFSSPLVSENETGEYGILFVSSSTTNPAELQASLEPYFAGYIFYEAGVAVISPYIFSTYDGGILEPIDDIGELNTNSYGIVDNNFGIPAFNGTDNIGQTLVSSSLYDTSLAFYDKILTASYQAVTELNSTIYFCRAFNNEFNYSSNPTYLSSSEIVVKEGDPMNQPVSYITTVGLYDDNNQLLAVAKLSEPIKKTPDTELIARVRLDF